MRIGIISRKGVVLLAICKGSISKLIEGAPVCDATII